MKYKIQRGFIPPVVDLQNPNAPMPTVYEVYEKKFLGPWTHVQNFETRFEAECWLYAQGAKYEYTYAEHLLKPLEV